MVAKPKDASSILTQRLPESGRCSAREQVSMNRRVRGGHHDTRLRRCFLPPRPALASRAREELYQPAKSSTRHCEFRTDRSGRPALDETAGERENYFLLVGSGLAIRENIYSQFLPRRRSRRSNPEPTARTLDCFATLAMTVNDFAGWYY